MRHLVMLLVAAAASVLSTAPAYADLGDQLAKLLADDGAEGDSFGSVAISGATAIVGAHRDDDNGPDSGSAYLFDTTTGRQIAKFVANDGAALDLFGISVAISGPTAIVGAYWDDDNGFHAGSAYLFDTTSDRQIAKLLANDGAFNDLFGLSVAISGTTAIVGASWDDDNGSNSGSAYLFDTTTGRQVAKLLPIDGAGGHAFGYSVAISGATAIVGAIHDDDNGPDSGSAYLFDTTTGRQIAQLLANDGAAGDLFGISVGISGATAIVGAWWDDDNGMDSGSAYLFDTTTGRQIAQLLANDGAALDLFGWSVAISGATAIVGARFDNDNGLRSGSAYLFDATTGRQIAKLLPDLTRTTATTPARRTSLMLPPPENAPGTLMATKLSARPISFRSWQVGVRAKAAPPTSTATATSARRTSSSYSPTGGRVPEEGIMGSWHRGIVGDKKA